MPLVANLVDEAGGQDLPRYICPPVLCGPPGPLKLLGKGPDGAPIPAPRKAFQFFEGDIVLEVPTNATRGRRKRAIIRPVTKLWKYGIIPYEIDPSLSPKAKDAIRNTMRQYQRKTCIRFRKRKKTDKDFIRYVYQPGCWSMVGRDGGKQLISIGNGCEEIGTVLHETGHALGFWHEQGRLDRDKYVKIIWENMSPTYFRQFGKREESESTSRGFAYDYESIMHYGGKFFSRNAKNTIRVIGIGKKLRLRIGQRKRLSVLDIAQLRAMYHCNAKHYDSQGCPGGWTRHRSNCYKPESKPMTFPAARAYCKKQGATLLHVESKAENEAVAQLLSNQPRSKSSWRAGGLKSGTKFVWVGRHKKRDKAMKYTAWDKGHPDRFNTLLLVRNNTDNSIKWQGIWAGSVKQPKKYAYPFICEKKANVTCFRSQYKDARDYRGRLDYTSQGITCQKWSSQYPHKHTGWYSSNKKTNEANGIGRHNYCRNPGGKRSRPWCFTTLEKTVWQYCGVDICK